MRLSAKILQNVADVNNWKYADQAYIYEGQINEFYIQLIDLSKIPDSDDGLGIIPEHPLRYMSQATAFSLKVIFDSVDNSEIYTISATKPFSDDLSIFKITLSSAQTPKAGAIKVILTEDAVDKSFIVQQAITVEYSEIGSC